MDSSLKHLCEILLFFINEVIDFFTYLLRTWDLKVGGFDYCCRSPTSFNKTEGKGDYDELFMWVYCHPLWIQGLKEEFLVNKWNKSSFADELSVWNGCFTDIICSKKIISPFHGTTQTVVSWANFDLHYSVAGASGALVGFHCVCCSWLTVGEY